MRSALLAFTTLAAGFTVSFTAGWWSARWPGSCERQGAVLESKVDRLAEEVRALGARLDAIVAGGPDGDRVHEVPLADSPARGPEDAPVTIVEFTDFECVHCAAMAPLLARLLAEHPTRVRWVFKHRPLPFHRRAVLAHRAAVAAGFQGKF